MNRRKCLELLIIALGCGVLLSIVYINPFTGDIYFSELILQLSGTRGEFTLGISLTELLSYNAKYIPYLLFELFGGISLYQSFCTASVYVFIRNPNKVHWYVKECCTLFGIILVYQLLLFFSVLLTTSVRYTIVLDNAGIKILAIHILLYSFWLFAMTLLINLFSIRFSSEIAYSITFGGQAMLVMLLATLHFLEGKEKFYSILININPISRLIIGWQKEIIEWTGYLLPGVNESISLIVSCIYIVLIAVIVATVGLIYIQKYDLLIADSEYGGA